jgi:hypothetical protein
VAQPGSEIEHLEEIRFMRAPVRTSALVIALALAPVSVGAEEQVKQYEDCTREPTEGDIAAAKGAFQAGQGSFNEADYPRAITYWEDALRRDCTANALLLNLARAYELYGQKRQAVVALQTYLKREPNSPQRDQINRRIEVLNNQIAAEQPVAQPTATAPTPTAAPTTVPPPPPVETPTEGKKPLLPLIVAGAGGVVAIVGGVLYLDGTAKVRDYEDKCPLDPKTDQHVCPLGVDHEAGNSAQTQRTIGAGVFIGGVAVAAGGLIWYVLAEPQSPRTGKRQPAAPRARLAPAVAPGFAGVAFSGRF